MSRSKPPKETLRSRFHNPEEKYSRMALTILAHLNDRQDTAAYTTSCHARTARFLSRSWDFLEGSDRLVFAGRGKLVFHSFVIDEKGKVLFDGQQAGRYDHERKEYAYANSAEILSVVSSMTLDEFYESYLHDAPLFGQGAAELHSAPTAE